MLPERFTPKYLRQLEMLKLNARRSFLGMRQGGHLSLKRGHGIEFFDYRQYELGDNPRHIDWGVFARTERLYVKRFQEEQDLTVMIVLDSSASMAAPEGEGKWEMARDLALSISYIALMQQDTVLLAYTNGVQSPVLTGGKAIHHASTFLQQPFRPKNDAMAREVLRAASRVRFPGVAIFISDFLMPIEVIEETLNVLRAKNLDITAVQILAPGDVDPIPSTADAVVVDSESNEEVELSLDADTRARYSELMSDHQFLLEDYCARNRIHFTQVLSTTALAEFVISDLSVTGLLT